MVRKAIVICLMLTGCSDQKQLWRESEIKEIADDSNAVLIQRIGRLEAQIAKLQGETISAKVTAEMTAEAHDSLVKTFNGNVRKDNEEAIREMTRRGACGSRPRYNYRADGVLISIVNETIPCTINDLRK